MPEKDLDTLIDSLVQNIDTKLVLLGGWENCTGFLLEIRKRKGDDWSGVAGDPVSHIRALTPERWLAEKLDGVQAYQVRVRLKDAEGIPRRTAQERWLEEDTLAVQRFEDQMAGSASRMAEANLKWGLSTASGALGKVYELMERACAAEAELKVWKALNLQVQEQDRLSTLLERGERLLFAFNAGTLSLSEAVARLQADPAGSVDILIAQGGLRKLLGALSDAQRQLLLVGLVEVMGQKEGVAEQVADGAGELVDAEPMPSVV